MVVYDFNVFQISSLFPSPSREWFGEAKKKPAFWEAGFSILLFCIYTIDPPPESAGIIMTTTIRIAAIAMTLLTMLFDMKGKIYCNILPPI